jgi:hypothetical protein
VYVYASPLAYTDHTGQLIDVVVDVGFILYDVYRIGADNVFGNCGNLGENLTALGLDVAGAVVPGVTGFGAASRVAKRAPGARPPKLSPPGAGHQGALNEVNRANGIPTRQQPARTLPNTDVRGNRQRDARLRVVMDAGNHSRL